MSDQYSADPFDDPLPEIALTFPPLPAWLERRVLRRGEYVTWVRGPRFSPAWERYVTHPALFLVALVLAAVCVGAGWRATGRIPPAAVAVGGGILLAAIFVLGVFAGHFTRLVVTNERVLILQGHEVCRRWEMDQLPRSLLRYRRRAGGEERPVIDLPAVQTMLGGAQGQFADARTILSFGKHLDQIRAREDRRGPADPPR